MALSKITREDYANKGVIGLADTPQLSTLDMQTKFEELSTDVIIPAHNKMVDDLSGVDGASNIGTSDGTNVQAAMANLNRKIETSVGDLTQLVEDMSQAKTDIAKSKTDIQKNTEDIASNTTNISKNTTDIATNKTAIQNTNVRVADLETDNATNKANISALQTDNTANKTDIANLKADNTANKSNISALQTDVSDLNAKKHTHTNKTVIDKLSDKGGVLQYNNKPIEGGGGGSKVTWQQNTTAGTKIAEITIDGATTEVYTPTGGGGGGATDYSVLTSKPQINGVELAGNKISAQLGLASFSDVYSKDDVYTKTEVDGIVDDYVPTARKVNGHALTSDVSVTKSDVGLGNVGNFKAVSTAASQGLTSTEKSNARTNIGAGTYSKPSEGIPESDLADAVKNKLVTDEISAKISKVDINEDVSTALGKKINAPTSATKDQVLTYNGSEWVADDSKGGGGSATEIIYDNSTSGLTSTNVQGAIDEVSEIKQGSVSAVTGVLDVNSFKRIGNICRLDMVLMGLNLSTSWTIIANLSGINLGQEEIRSIAKDRYSNDVYLISISNKGELKIIIPSETTKSAPNRTIWISTMWIV